MNRALVLYLLSMSISLFDANFAHDNVGRYVTSERANGLRSRYEYDAAGRLQALRHTQASKTLAQFINTVDARGNRIQAQETIAHPATPNDVTIAYNDSSIATLRESAASG